MPINTWATFPILPTHHLVAKIILRPIRQQIWQQNARDMQKNGIKREF